MIKSNECCVCGKLDTFQNVYVVGGKNYCASCMEKFREGIADATPSRILIINPLCGEEQAGGYQVGHALVQEGDDWFLVIDSMAAENIPDPKKTFKYKLPVSFFDGLTKEDFPTALRDVVIKAGGSFDFDTVKICVKNDRYDINLISSLFTPESEPREALINVLNAVLNKEKQNNNAQEDYIDDLSFIKEMKHSKAGAFEQYDILIDARIYGWETILIWADYLLKTDIDHLSSMTFVGIPGGEELELIEKYKESGQDILHFDFLNHEGSAFSVAGSSRVLNDMVKIVWFNQTKTLRFFCLTKDETTVRKYLETICRKNFGTPDEMKLARPHEGSGKPDGNSPVSLDGQIIKIDSAKFFGWQKNNPNAIQYEFTGAVHLTEREPVLTLMEDGAETLHYCLQTEEGEDFTGKYFLISVRLGIMRGLGIPYTQIDGLISDTPEDRKYQVGDIGYRMEAHFLICGGEAAEKADEESRGKDLVEKGLKYPGYTTPSGIRLIGICPDCSKSFAFHGYSFYMADSEPAYSDDGLDVCEIREHEIDKENWKQEINGKTYRYYNSFCCPHCGTPYIDYKSHPEIKKFGVSGCCHIGRKVVTANPEKTEEISQEQKNGTVKESVQAVDHVTDDNTDKSKDKLLNRIDLFDDFSKDKKQRRALKRGEKLKAKEKKKDKDPLLVRLFDKFGTKAMAAGFIMIFGGILLNACNLDTKTGGYFGLAAFSYACFILGVLLWFVLLVAEEMSAGKISAYFMLSVLSFAFAVISIHTFFTLTGIYDLTSRQILSILAIAGACGIAGLVFHILSSSKKKSTSPFNVIKDDADTVKSIFFDIPYSSDYRYNKRIIRLTRTRMIQRYPEKSMEKFKDSITYDLDLFYSWPAIWIFTFVCPLFFASVPALIHRMHTNADKDKKKTLKRLIPYTVFCFLVSLFYAIGFIPSTEFTVGSAVFLVLLSPVIQLFTSLYFLIFYPKRKEKSITKDELCKNLILTDKITDINIIAEKAGITYSRALRIIDGLIYDNIIPDAFIDYSGEEVIVKGITDKVALKCYNCGSTSVFRMNETQKCKWCGADYE